MEILAGIGLGIVFIVLGALMIWLIPKSRAGSSTDRSARLSVVFIIAGLYLVGGSIWKFVSAPFFPPTPTPFTELSNYISPTVDPTTVCILYHSCVQPTKIQATAEINYRPITWMELNGFLAADNTNINSTGKYNLNYYNCLDFSVTLVENAGKQDIKAWIIIVEFTDGSPGHAFVAFETTDLGVVFIEPQLDIRTDNPVVGKPLCLAWGDYECMGTIKSIEYDQCDHSHNCNPYTP